VPNDSVRKLIPNFVVQKLSTYIKVRRFSDIWITLIQPKSLCSSCAIALIKNKVLFVLVKINYKHEIMGIKKGGKYPPKIKT
jgi:hypothetical protein